MFRALLFTPYVTLAVMLAAPILIRAGLIAPLGGFGAFIGAWVVGAGTGLLGGGLGLLKADLRAAAWPALGVGLVLAISLLVTVSRSDSVPIHDLTTDLDDPPPFTVAAEHPDNAGRDMSYPHGTPSTAALQREYFGAVEGAIHSDLALAEARERCLELAAELGWRVTWANTAEGLIEAETSTPLFRFVDDVVIRLRTEGDGSAIDVRSLSRVGRGDLGANAARILRFKELWAE